MGYKIKAIMFLDLHCLNALDGLEKEELENNLVDQASSSKMPNIPKKVNHCTFNLKKIYIRHN